MSRFGKHSKPLAKAPPSINSLPPSNATFTKHSPTFASKVPTCRPRKKRVPLKCKNVSPRSPRSIPSTASTPPTPGKKSSPTKPNSPVCQRPPSPLRNKMPLKRATMAHGALRCRLPHSFRFSPTPTATLCAKNCGRPMLQSGAAKNTTTKNSSARSLTYATNLPSSSAKQTSPITSPRAVWLPLAMPHSNSAKPFSTRCKLNSSMRLMRCANSKPTALTNHATCSNHGKSATGRRSNAKPTTTSTKRPCAPISRSTA